jgi:Skp family chaperone for outer membrane proteins
MKKLALLTLASLQLCAAEAKVGIVNFVSCVTESKIGKQEQSSMDDMRKQIMTLMEDKEKQLKEVTEQLQDKDYLDGLSPEGEQELKGKWAQLSEEMNRYNQQYYQFMQQGQGRMIQTVVGGINSAAEKLASTKGYSMIINKEACFFYDPKLDITADVIKEMDKSFDDAEKKQTTEKK